MNAHIKNIIDVAIKQLITEPNVNVSNIAPILIPVIKQYITYNIIVNKTGIFLIIPDNKTAMIIGIKNITYINIGTVLKISITTSILLITKNDDENVNKKPINNHIKTFLNIINSPFYNYYTLNLKKHISASFIK